MKSLSTSSTSDGTSYSVGSTDTTLHMMSRLGSDSMKLEVTTSSSLERSFLMVDKGGKILSVAGLFTISKTAACFPLLLSTFVTSFKASAFF